MNNKLDLPEMLAAITLVVVAVVLTAPLWGPFVLWRRLHYSRNS